MIRLLIRLVIALALILSLLMVASTVMGRGIDTTIGAALVSPANSRGIYIRPTQIALFDLKRRLRADHDIPLERIDFSAFDYSVTSPDKVIITTFRAPGVNGEPGGLYYYNFFTGHLTTVFKSDLNPNSHYFNPMFSPDGQKLAFIHPLDKLPYLFDTETAEVSAIAFDAIDPTTDSLDLRSWDWSPDSTKMVIRGARRFYIVEVDNPNADREPLEIPIEAEDIYPVWSADSRYIQLQRSGGNPQTMNSPVTIVDTTGGSEHPLTKDLQASSAWWWPWWGCDNRWLTYTVVTETLREGYILDLQDGTTARVNDATALAEESIEGISPAPNCRQFIVSGERMGEPGMRTSLELDARNTYVFDSATNTAEFIDETAALIQLTDASDAYYLAPDVDRNLWQVFRRSLDPLGEPILVSQYPPFVAAYFQWAPDMTFATYLETTPSQASFVGKLRRLDAATGQTFPLISDNEIAQSYVQYNWSDLQRTE